MRAEVVFLVLLLLLLCGRGGGVSLERQALDEVRQSLQDPTDFFSSWDVTLISPCTWTGVTCDEEQQSVEELSMVDKQLSGTLSGSIGELGSLKVLRLAGNNISGPIPDTIGNLKNLVTLDLGSNSFSGSIPASLADLRQLQILVLRNNNLSGQIPAEITGISSLHVLDLSSNRLSGKVPADPAGGATFNVSGNELLCGEKVRVQCPGDPPLPSVDGGKGGRKGGEVAAATAAAGAVVVLVLVAGGVWWRKRRRRKEESEQEFFDVQDEEEPRIRYAQLREFTLRELQVATEQFHQRHVLGQGGFGKVFKGVLEDGSVVAVKRLNKAGGMGGGEAGGEQAFQVEVEMISLAVHRNLLRLHGYCVTQTERMLVYPYMRNGCVAQRLRDSGNEVTLDWSARRKIALGAARGLGYLHDFCEPKIIHRDVKAANVLLDENLEAVVGDFGLAKLLDGSQTHITTIVRGTAGHIAPEYLTTGKSSEKTDVFGYGILLLELLTGQRAFDFARLAAEDDVMLLDWVKRLQREGRQEELVDPKLLTPAGAYNAREAEELIKVALLCTQTSPADRPRMADVVRMLEGDGLAERWQEWQRVEVVRRRETDSLPRPLPQWVHDSTCNLDAIQLSAGR